MALNIKALGTYFHKQATFFYVNWVPGGVRTVYALAEVAQKYGVGLGGPDVHPDVNMQSYPVLEVYKDKLPIMMDVQWSNYEHTTKPGDAEELYSFATEKLGAKYICWMLRRDFKNNVLLTIDKH